MMVFLYLMHGMFRSIVDPLQSSPLSRGRAPLGALLVEQALDVGSRRCRSAAMKDAWRLAHHNSVWADGLALSSPLRRPTSRWWKAQLPASVNEFQLGFTTTATDSDPSPALVQAPVLHVKIFGRGLHLLRRLKRVSKNSSGIVIAFQYCIGQFAVLVVSWTSCIAPHQGAMWVVYWFERKWFCNWFEQQRF
jgi:hypothetical protein